MLIIITDDDDDRKLYPGTLGSNGCRKKKILILPETEQFI